MDMVAVTDDTQEPKNLKVVKKMIGYELYNRKLDLDIVNPSSNRGRMLSDAMKFFKYSFRSRFLGSHVAIVVRSVLWTFFQVLLENRLRYDLLCREPNQKLCPV